MHSISTIVPAPGSAAAAIQVREGGLGGKKSIYTSFMAAKFFMSARYTAVPEPLLSRIWFAQTYHCIWRPAPCYFQPAQAPSSGFATQYEWLSWYRGRLMFVRRQRLDLVLLRQDLLKSAEVFWQWRVLAVMWLGRKLSRRNEFSRHDV